MRISPTYWHLAYGGGLFGWEAADAYAESFDHAFELIRAYPLIGAVHEFVRPPVRALAHRRHRIFYDLLDEGVVVRRILHMTMDVSRHL